MAFKEDGLDDPLDFIAPDLQNIDEHLRCPICKELLNATIMLNTCSHSFCALCIRRSLSQEQLCPKCRTPALESNLIPNYDLDNVVLSWRNSRKLLLDMDEQYNKKPSQSIDTLCQNMTVNDSEPEQSNSKSKSTVECPVCGKSIEFGIINQHVDKCLKGESTSIPSLFNKKEKSINLGKKPTKLVYAVMSDKELRDCLKSLNLPDHGDRAQKIWRHKEYLNLYNANYDSQHPVSAKVLVQQLNTMENAQSSTQLKRKPTDPEVHKRKYANHFSSLIENVKRSKKDNTDTSSSSSDTNKPQD